MISLDRINLEEFEPAIRDQINQAFEQAAKRSTDAAAVGKLGMIFQVYGKYEMAEACYLRVRDLDPRAFRWTYLLGVVEGYQGKHSPAIEHTRAAIALDGSYTPARVRLAELLLDSGDAEQSEAEYRNAVRQDAKLASAHFGLGKVQAARGDLTAAIQSYRRACELSGNYAAAHYALAMAYRQAGDMANARSYLERHRRVKQTKQPSFDPLMDEVNALYSGGLTHLAKGSALVKEDKLREAAVEFEAALAANPNMMMARINLIAMYGQLGQPEKAEQHFRAAIEVDPGWVETYFNWGMFLVGQGRKAEATESFRKAVELNPNYADAHVQLASLLDEAGKSKEAAAHYQRALEINPEHRQAHYLFGHNLARSGQFGEAIKHLLETVKVEDNRTPICMHALALAYHYSGNRAQALHYVREARRRAATFGMNDLVAQLDRDLKRLSGETGRR